MIANVGFIKGIALLVVGGFYLFRKKDIELLQRDSMEPVNDKHIIRGLLAIAIPVTS